MCDAPGTVGPTIGVTRHVCFIDNDLSLGRPRADQLHSELWRRRWQRPEMPCSGERDAVGGAAARDRDLVRARAQQHLCGASAGGAASCAYSRLHGLRPAVRVVRPMRGDCLWVCSVRELLHMRRVQRAVREKFELACDDDLTPYLRVGRALITGGTKATSRLTNILEFPIKWLAGLPCAVPTWP